LAREANDPASVAAEVDRRAHEDRVEHGRIGSPEAHADVVKGHAHAVVAEALREEGDDLAGLPVSALVDDEDGAHSTPPGEWLGQPSPEGIASRVPRRKLARMSTRRSVGLVSDTHGFVPEALLKAFAGVECIVHAGDIGRIEVLDALEAVAPVHAVHGNIDGGELRALPEDLTIAVGGKRISVLHIAGNPRRPSAAARRVLTREKPDVFICGHSHIWVVAEVMGALWINPGAAGNQGFHTMRTGAILHVLADGELGLDRVEMGARGR
jgi:putative phosphoesterase